MSTWKTRWAISEAARRAPSAAALGEPGTQKTARPATTPAIARERGTEQVEIAESGVDRLCPERLVPVHILHRQVAPDPLHRVDQPLGPLATVEIVHTLCSHPLECLGHGRLRDPVTLHIERAVILLEDVPALGIPCDDTASGLELSRPGRVDLESVFRKVDCRLEETRPRNHSEAFVG